MDCCRLVHPAQTQACTGFLAEEAGAILLQVLQHHLDSCLEVIVHSVVLALLAKVGYRTPYL